MSIFLALSAEGTLHSQVSDAALERLRSRLHIEADTPTRHLSSDGSAALIHFARGDMLYDERDQVCVSRPAGAGVTALTVTGQIWRCADDRPHPLTAREVTHLAAGQPLEIIRGTCDGEYAVVRLESDGTLEVCNDPVALETVYVGERGGIFFVSNRASLIACAMGDDRPDAESLADLGVFGSIIGTGTSYASVSRLAQNGLIRCHRGRAQITRGPLPFSDGPSREEAQENFDELFEEGYEQLTVGLRALLHRADAVPLPLTGGKDSRAVLGLALSAGLTDRLTTWTNGPPTHPDVLVAERLANHYDLEHTNPQQNTPQSAPPRVVIQRLLAHVFQTDGMLNCWDLKGYPRTNPTIVLAGQYGEVYRSYNRTDMTFGASSDAGDFMRQLGLFDGAGFLRDEAREHFESKLTDRADEFLDRGADIDDVPDLFHAVDRTANWVAELRRFDGYGTRLVYPLRNQRLSQLAFALGSEQRSWERIHFEITRRADPWLVEQPFALQRWHPALGQFSGDLDLDAEPLPPSPGVKMLGSWQHLINHDNEAKSCYRHMLLADPDSALWDLLDRQRVDRFFEKSSYTFTELYSFYGYLTMAMWLNGYQLPQRLERPGSAEPEPRALRPAGSKRVFHFDGTDTLEVVPDGERLATLGFDHASTTATPRHTAHLYDYLTDAR